MGKLIELYPDGPPRPAPPVHPKPESGTRCSAATVSNWYWGKRGGDRCKNRATTTRDGQPYCRVHAEMRDD